MILKGENVKPWWVTPVLTGMLIYIVLGWIDVNSYSYHWPLFIIGYLSWWAAELLGRAARAILGHSPGSSS
jgi:hypothetical protein